MPKHTTDLRLAQTAKEHQQLEQQVEELVDQLIHHGESECANRLFALIELLTDTRTNASDREGLSFQALQRAFVYTDAGQKAIEEEITRINPRLTVPSYIAKAS